MVRSFLKLKTDNRFYYILFVVGVALFATFFLFQNIFSPREPFHSVEVGVATVSSVHKEGGLAVPASCPAFAHTVGECDPSVDLTVDGRDAITVDPGQRFTLAWTNNPNTFGCTATGDWTVPGATTTNSRVVESETVVGTHVYRMTCRGASLTEAVNFNLSLPGALSPGLPYPLYVPTQQDAYYHRPLSEYSSRSVDYIPLTEAMIYLHRAFTQPLSIYAADIAVGSDNIPRIAYYDYSRTSIELYTCSDPYCSGPGRTDVIAASPVGAYNSYPAITLALSASNNPTISFYYVSGRARVYTCADQYCVSNSVADTSLPLVWTPTPAPGRWYQPIPRYYYAINRGMSTPVTARINDIQTAGIDTTGYDTSIQGSGTPDHNSTLSISYAYRPNGEMVAIYPVTSVLNGEGFFGITNYFGVGPYASFGAAYPSMFVEGGVGVLNIKGLRLKCQGNLCDKTLTPVNTWQTQQSPLDTVSVIVRGAPAPVVPTISTTCLAPGTSARVTGSSSGATRYEVQISTNNAMTGATTATVNNSLLDHTFTGLTPGANYHINARACNPTSCSAFSIPVTQYCTPALTPTADLKILPPSGAGFLPSPHTVNYGESLRLSWVSSYANHCVLTRISPTPQVEVYNGPDTSNATGLPTGALTRALYTYRLICDNSGIGPLYQESPPSYAEVRVRPTVDINVQDPVSSLWVNGPVTIDYNTNAVLAWLGRNATRCEIRRTPPRPVAQGGEPNFTGVSSPGINGVSTGNLRLPSYSYTATCFNGNPVGSNSFSDAPVVVNVNASTAAVTCDPSTTRARVGDLVTWTATPTSTPPPYFFWWGAQPTSDASDCTQASWDSPFECRYSTAGTYSMDVVVNGSASASCNTTVVVDDSGPVPLTPPCVAWLLSDNSIMWGSGGGPGATPPSTFAWTLSTGQTSTRTSFTSGPYTPGSTVSGQVTVTDSTGRTGTASCPAVTVPLATPVCGNNTVETGESCDDGNTDSGDGCSASCTIEGTPVCNFNAVCQPLNGETPLNCTDCKKDIEEQ